MTEAEPFKRWLAKVGYECIQEIEDPELASQRAREIYKAKGYDNAWIEKRMRGIQVRGELTEEWKNRDVGSSKEYAILTAEISKATFGMTPTEYTARTSHFEVRAVYMIHCWRNLYKNCSGKL